MPALCSSPTLWWASVFGEALPISCHASQGFTSYCSEYSGILVRKKLQGEWLELELTCPGKEMWNKWQEWEEQHFECIQKWGHILLNDFNWYSGLGRLCVLCREQAPIWGSLLFLPLVATQLDKYNFYLKHTGIRQLFLFLYLWLELWDKSFTCTTKTRFNIADNSGK